MDRLAKLPTVVKPPLPQGYLYNKTSPTKNLSPEATNPKESSAVVALLVPARLATGSQGHGQGVQGPPT